MNGAAEPDPARGPVEREVLDIDLVNTCVIDPAKVERVALQNAASVATLLLTTDALVSDMPEDEKSDKK